MFSSRLFNANKYPSSNANQFISTNTSPSNLLNPYYVTGFTDGEGCFLVSISRDPLFKTGFKVKLSFQIGSLLHEKDLALLKLINSYFDVGSITKLGKESSFQYRVQSIKDLKVIVAHFDNYPLITQK